jgi:anti-sigma regulatory factor (Ser/Thr protein kinase)
VAVFVRATTSVASARGWLTSFLHDHGVSPAVTEDAVLVMSELVTNALRHGAGDIVTRGSLVDGELSVAVTDAGAELPALLPADPYRVGGVGLMIVDRLADRWGVHPFRGGKTVWATLASGRG